MPELSKTYDLESERIAIGFGSDDLLAQIARALSTARHGVAAKPEQLFKGAKLRLW